VNPNFSNNINTDIQFHCAWDKRSSLVFNPALIKELYELDFQNGAYPWGLAAWQDFLQSNEYYFLAFLGTARHLWGLALFMALPGEITAHLLKIVVHNEQRKKGWGERLFKESTAHLKTLGFSSIYLEVGAENHPACQLYRKMGLQELRRVPRFYSDGKDALIMSTGLPAL